MRILSTNLLIIKFISRDKLNTKQFNRYQRAVSSSILNYLFYCMIPVAHESGKMKSPDAPSR
jgi:hypothetical protein